ncbi:apolipoprotein B receptor-like [Eublepharis macularius]|uniref:Apolipoprotein B receptor-like n=1 Tax=Eublepharis macularius TaxID=481883 RepID=A0AA97LG21_EUBMA|nr:apolipoprotein B receptor-like [Eublepharis macularius]
MDLFQRLLGTLQQTVDYISTFTTYLLGDEAHPGAEPSGSTGETVPHRSHHEHEVEAARYGDISPTGNLKAFEGPPIAEIISPNWEIQETSEKTFSCAQVTEPSLRPSKLPCKYEGKEDVGRRLSEPANFLADIPKPRSMRTGSIQQRDLEGTSVPRGLHHWEPEGRARMGVVRHDFLEEMADMKDWKPEKPVAGGQEQKELGGSGKAERLWQKEEEETEGDEQKAPGGAESEEEEQRGLDGAAQTGEFQQGVAKMAESQQPEADRQLIGGIKMEDNQKKEPDIDAGNEGVQKAVPNGAETGGEQQGGRGGKAESRDSLQWEPKETGTLGVRDEDPKGVAEKRDRQRLEGAETEGHQLEGSVGNERTRWREQEENEGDERVATVAEESVVEEQRGDGRAWSGKFQEEVAKMVEAQWLEAEGQLAGGAEAENYKQGEPDMEAEGALQAVPDDADQQAEAEVRRKLHWELEETLEQHPGKGNSQQQGLEVAGEREERQHGELEGLVRIEVETEEEKWELQMVEATLETEQQTDETLLETTALEEEVVAAGREDPEVEGQEPEGTKKNLLPEPMGCNAPLDACCLAGAGTFPAEVQSLDTSAQKQRVLLRRKSSIRRAPSLKRPRPPMQTPPLETGIVENPPFQPPALSRPNLRHAGFGPVHPNMMAELQMRLRRPK